MPSEADMFRMIPIIADVLNNTMDEILTDACWCISYISDGGARTIPRIMESGVTERLVQLMAHPNSGVAIPSLRSIGNFVTGADEQTDVVLNNGVLQVLDSLLEHQEQMIRKETVWTISNICAGNSS